MTHGLQLGSQLAPHVTLQAEGISLCFEPDCGFLCDLAIEDAGQAIRPMHRVPWQEDELPAGLPPHLARMAGDFFCAPFADGGSGVSPLHGAPANGQWLVDAARSTAGALTAQLQATVAGGSLTKRAVLRDGHPFVYQSHLFEGGAGEISLANHAMVSLPQGGRISCSPKTAFCTPQQRLEPDATQGRSALAYPAHSTDPARFPRADGGSADLTRYPFEAGHEDLVVATEAPGHGLGWTAVVRQGFGDLYLSLRNARQLPMTVLWHSDGGRDYAPWNGRHRGCLGVEEGYAPHLLDAPGGVDITTRCDIRHAIGAVAWPSEEPVRQVLASGTQLEIHGSAGTLRRVPFELSHLFPEGDAHDLI